jgi:choline kinase
VYKAKEYVNNESFILSMSDHLVCVSALERIVRYSEDDNLLMVDPFIQENFDLDDATKVQVENGFITSIGKKIDVYNSLDCGIFRLNSAFFEAVEKAVESGDESISGAIMQLVNNRCMKAITLDAPNQWIDVDTPEAYEHALNTFSSDLYLCFLKKCKSQYCKCKIWCPSCPNRRDDAIIPKTLGYSDNN